MRVAEVMSKPVRVIPGDEQASLAWEQMRLHQSHHLVVTGPGGLVVGVISAGDLGAPGRRGPQRAGTFSQPEVRLGAAAAWRRRPRDRFRVRRD